jgi:hypothetical protein
VTPSPAECTETLWGFRCTRRDFEPPHLAVPEPKSGGDVASGSERARMW